MSAARCYGLGALALVLAILAIPACWITDLSLWVPGEAPAETFEVEEVRNLAYHDGPDATSRHRLELYLPRGLKDFPVVVFVHGGCWMMACLQAWDCPSAPTCSA